MIVKDLMTANVCFAYEDATALDIAKIMNQKNIGLVPICEPSGALLGFITDRDILLKVAEDNNENLNSLKAKDIMTKDIYCVNANDNIHIAALSFSKYKVRRLAVIDDKKLIGILSLSDLAKKKVLLSEVGDIMKELGN